MTKITYTSGRLGNLNTKVCNYRISDDVDILSRFNRIYVHNTHKFTDLDDLLGFHRNVGFAGIGYHFAVSSEGTVYATRPLEIQGAHVLGRNRDSVGVVFLDVDKCSKSRRAKRSFHRLHGELSNLAGESLPVFPHSYGQFEYLKQLVDEYNNGLENEEKFPEIRFGLEIGRNRILAIRKAEVFEMIMQQRKKGVPEQKKGDFQKIVRFSDKLKICPGEAYLKIVEGI